MSEISNRQPSLQSRLARYSFAAGAGVLASGGVAALPPANVPPMPVEALPITLDSSVLVDAPLLLDLDSNGDIDFRVYYKLEYGGGFAIHAFPPATPVGSAQVQVHWQYLDNVGTQVAARNDRTEYVPVNNTYNIPSQIYYMYTSSAVYLDRNATGPLAAYTPFRNNPGFLGLALGTADYSVGRAATLKVSLNSSGTQLTIHSGWYRNDAYDLYLDDGILHASGFEDYPQSDYFPAETLSVLAEGDTGETHD